LSLYTYSASDRDLGNTRSEEEFWEQYSFIIRNLLRITKPGRLTCVHCADVPTTKVHDGYIGLKDFPGDCVRHYKENGWTFHGRVTIDRNPQAVAVRTHAKGLLFVQLQKDSTWMRSAIGDQILMFRKDGENEVPVVPDVDNETWIKWAYPVWYEVRETDTLNVAEARTEQDEKHLCPLALPIIERCVRLYSNPGEIVLTPFAGIGSEVYQSVLLGRRGLGVELKKEYFNTAVLNCQRAESMLAQKSLFGVEDLE
jgi:DNA modification methylase